MANGVFWALIVILLVDDSQAYFSVTNAPLIASALQKSREKSYPRNSKCEDVGRSLMLNLRNVGLQRVDSNFTDSLSVACLDLEDNGITHVSPTAFQLMPNLLYLNLAHNKLSLANFSQLSNHSNLRTLILDDNQSPSDETATLEFANVFPGLVYLSARGSSLERLPSLEFAPNLEQLYLSSNKLGTSELSFLNDVSAPLTSLDLSDNAIQGLNASKSIQDLQLDDNQIKRLCGKSYCRESALVLEGATDLKRLSLVRNGLTSIEPDAFDDAVNLEYLNLSYNRIDSIRKDTFEKTNSLNNLTLDHNLLSEMPDLYGLESLVYLSLAHNALQIVNNDSLASNGLLKYLDLSNNQISFIEKNALNRQSLMEELNLSNNRLTSFPDMWLYPLTNLMILQIDGNQFIRFEDIKMNTVRMQSKLRHIYMRNNSITRISTMSIARAFYHIPNITLELFDDHIQYDGLRLTQSNDDTCKICNCEEDNEITF